MKKKGKDNLPSITVAICRHKNMLFLLKLSEILIKVEAENRYIPLMWFYENKSDAFDSQGFPQTLMNSQNVLMKSLLHKEEGASRLKNLPKEAEKM